ncbi:MAG: hypothetical protein ABW205_11670, partial [Burkholderiales bacterium]
MLRMPISRSRHPTTEVARADAKLEKLQQLSRRPLKEQTSFQKQKRALCDVNNFASSTVIKQGFNGDGAVVSYLENKGDNHETCDPGTSLCVRALKY